MKREEKTTPRLPQDRWLALALCALVAAVFAQTLRFGFVYDDRWTLIDNLFLRTPGNFWALWGPGPAQAGVPDAGRPLMLATEMLDFALFGLRPAGFHFVSVAWHVAVVALFCATLRRWGLGRVAAGGAAAIFAIHPLVVEPVAAINYREDLLAGFFVLGALWLAAGRSAVAHVAAGGAALLAGFAKENAALVPALFLCVDWLAAGAGTAPVRRRWTMLAALAAAAAIPLGWRAWVMDGVGVVSRTAEIPEAHRQLAYAVPRGALAFVHGVGQFVWPRGLAPEYPDFAASPATSALGWGCLASIVAVLALAFRFRHRAPALASGLLCAVIAYLPHFGLVPLTNLRADRYFYLPALGLSLAAAAALARLATALSPPGDPAGGRPGLARWVPLALPAIAVFALALRAAKQVRIFRDDVTLFSAATAAAPKSQRAFIGLAAAELRRGQTVAAAAAADQAVALGDAARAREIRGLVALAQGDATAAWADLTAALAGAAPAHRPQVLNNLGYAEKRAGHRAEARDHLRAAVALAPHFDRPALHLAQMAIEDGDLDEARRLLTALLTRVPGSADAFRLLAGVEERAGRPAEAAMARDRARALGAE